MQVILLERVEKLGQMGDEVRVKDGFARNFLLPKKKALRATKANREYFQAQKAHLESANAERKKGADAIAAKLNGKSFVLIRQAGDRGQLYGSVSPRDVADVGERAGDEAERQARGEDVLAGRPDREEAKVAAEELFEEAAGPKPEGEEAEAAEA